MPTGLGKALVNANHRPRNQLRADKASLHYADLTTLPSSSAQPSHLASVTDRSELDEFLHSAIAAEETFEAEKQQLVVLQSDAFEANTSKREYNSAAFVSPAPSAATSAASSSSSSAAAAGLPSIPIPRRPQWTTSMSAEELAIAERDAFLTWRRQLATLEDEQLILMTPFEKNIEVWKQLWRVIDRCSVVATIVDARNPLLYRSEDMEQYVTELGAGSKVNVMVVNKADYLSVEQRRLWVRWFDRAGTRVVFWSAARSIEREEEKERKKKERERRRQEREANRERGLILGLEKVNLEQAVSDDGDDGHGDERKDDDGKAKEEASENSTDTRQQSQSIESGEDREEKKEAKTEEEDGHHGEQAARLRALKDIGVEVNSDSTTPSLPASDDGSQQSIHNSTDVLTRDQLLDYLRQTYQSIHPAAPVPSSSASNASPSHSRIHIGFVGFPNVGKSTTINALMLGKRVTVGATPGKTKHFQTLNCEDDLTLCDVPGLVMPSFLASRAELVCNGVMPIDQMREYANYTAPVALMVRRVGAEQLRQQYSLVFPHWRQDEDDGEGETTLEVEAEYRRRAEEVLNAHARMRGWMKDHGRPDESRSARVLLKDLFTGKLLYCYRPPGMSAEEVREWKAAERKSRTASRIVGEWKGEDVEQDVLGEADDVVGEDDDEEDDGVLAARMVREQRGKVNKHVMQQMLQDEYDDELALQDEDGMAGGSRAGQPTKKQLLRERQRTKRRTGKAVKLKKTDVSQDAVQLRIGGLSEGAAIRMGVVQSSKDGGPQKLKGSLTRS